MLAGSVAADLSQLNGSYALAQLRVPETQKAPTFRSRRTQMAAIYDGVTEYFLRQWLGDK